jgi:oligopeptide transport system permease protein
MTNLSQPLQHAIKPIKGRSPWQDALIRLKRNKAAVWGGIFVLFVTLLCALLPIFLSYEFDEIFWDAIASPPSPNHWFGTDSNGRDLLIRILYGGQVSLTVGISATLVSLVIGVIYGAIAGYVGGRIDDLMMRFVDILYAIPFTFFVILLMVFFGRNFLLIFVAIGAISWLDMARIVRGQTLSIKRREFIEAAHAIGVRPITLIRRHIIPNTLGPVVVYMTLTVPEVILLESFLSFLGLGVQEPMTSWGVQIAEGAQVMETYPWMLLLPGSFLALTLLALNFLGDGIRDALDPRDR